MRYPKRTQYKHAKSQYRVRNWPDMRQDSRSVATSQSGSPMPRSMPGVLRPPANPAVGVPRRTSRGVGAEVAQHATSDDVLEFLPVLGLKEGGLVKEDVTVRGP